jgi:hypothetical protein
MTGFKCQNPRYVSKQVSKFRHSLQHTAATIAAEDFLLIFESRTIRVRKKIARSAQWLFHRDVPKSIL